MENTTKVKLTYEMFRAGCSQLGGLVQADPSFNWCLAWVKEMSDSQRSSHARSCLAKIFYEIMKQLLWEYEKVPRLTYETWNGCLGSFECFIDNLGLPETNEALDGKAEIHGRFVLRGRGHVFFYLSEREIFNGYEKLAPIFEDIAWKISRGEYDIDFVKGGDPYPPSPLKK